MSVCAVAVLPACSGAIVLLSSTTCTQHPGAKYVHVHAVSAALLPVAGVLDPACRALASYYIAIHKSLHSLAHGQVQPASSSGQTFGHSHQHELKFAAHKTH